MYKINPLAAGRVGVGVEYGPAPRNDPLIGTFDEALDAGTPTCSGRDTEMFSRILREGYRMSTDPAADSTGIDIVRVGFLYVRQCMVWGLVLYNSIWTRQLFYEPRIWRSFWLQ